MLATATVNKIRCEFVNQMHKYISCTKYSLDCCLEDVLQAFLNAKLALYEDCDLTYEQECKLSSLKLTDNYIDCANISPSTPCNEQATLSLSKKAETVTYKSFLFNNYDGSSFVYINYVNDATSFTGYIDAYTTDAPYLTWKGNTVVVPSPNYQIYDVDTLQTGDRLIGGVPTARNPFKYSTNQDIPGLASYVANNYISKLRLHFTDSSGAYGGPIDLDVNPATTPYLSCVGCPHTVVDTDLWVWKTQFPTAFKNLIGNAVYSLTGDEDYVDLNVYVDTVSGNIRISTTAKHNPSSYWFGIKRGNGNDGYLVYHNALTGKDTTVSSVSAGILTADMYDTASGTCPCGNVSIVVPNHQLYSAPAFDFNYISTTNPLTLQSVSTSSNSLSCTKLELSAAVSSIHAHTIIWYNPSAEVISTSDTATVYSPANGTYTARIQLATGCVLEQSINYP